MNKKIKVILVIAILSVASFFLFKPLLIRTVNYEIAGVKIPSTYNLLTGTVRPITNYKGKAGLPTMQPSISGNIGLSKEGMALAKLRWALFEAWVSQEKRYKDWESNPETFKKARAEFRKTTGL